MVKLDQLLEFGQRSSDCHIHTPGSDSRIGLPDMKEDIVNLDLVCATDHNLITWGKWYDFIQEINKNRTDDQLTYTMPGSEVSLAYKDKTVHTAIYFACEPGERQESLFYRMCRVKELVLDKINDKVITKFENALQSAIDHFSKNEFISTNPKRYLINRHMVMSARRPHYIKGNDEKKGFYYTDIIRVMNALNKRMLDDGIINDLEKGYGTPAIIEGYFHKKKSDFDPPTQGLLLENYERVSCEQTMPILTEFANIIGIAHAKRKELVPEFKERGWINAIGFVDQELAKKYDLMILPGSDYHGGEFRKEKIGCDEKGNRLPSCVSMLNDKGFCLFS